MALQVVTVATSISDLSVSGVTIKDLDEIPNEVYTRDCPIVLPSPDFITNMRLRRESQGSGSVALWQIKYNLTYRLFYGEVGTGRILGDNYSGLVAKAMLFVDAVIANSELTGSIDSTLFDISFPGVVTDPADNNYFGCEIIFEILEFIN
jgi:hypothetical protein